MMKFILLLITFAYSPFSLPCEKGAKVLWEFDRTSGVKQVLEVDILAS